MRLWATQVLNIRLLPSPLTAWEATMGKFGHSNSSVLRSIFFVGCGFGFLALIAPTTAAAQDDRRERQFQRLVEQKQQYEAAEREKDRKLQLELERARADRIPPADTGQYSNRTSSNSGSQFYNVSGGDALMGTNAATYRLSNGVILRASGDFLPDPPGECIANCK